MGGRRAGCAALLRTAASEPLTWERVAAGRRRRTLPGAARSCSGSWPPAAHSSSSSAWLPRRAVRGAPSGLGSSGGWRGALRAPACSARAALLLQPRLYCWPSQGPLARCLCLADSVQLLCELVGTPPLPRADVLEQGLGEAQRRAAAAEAESAALKVSRPRGLRERAASRCQLARFLYSPPAQQLEGAPGAWWAAGTYFPSPAGCTCCCHPPASGAPPQPALHPCCPGHCGEPAPPDAPAALHAGPGQGAAAHAA